MSFVVHVQPQDGSVGQTEAAACCVRTSVTWAVWQGCFAHGCSALSVSLDREAGLVKQDYPLIQPHIMPSKDYSKVSCLSSNLLVSCFLFFRKRAARDLNLAMVLFQVLLENLDIQHSRFVQEESFLLQHNIRRYKQNFQVCGKQKHWVFKIFLNGNAHC